VQHSDDTITTVTKDEVIHAEANAIIKLARDGESGKSASLFCTHAPCIHCAKLIHGAGISKVYYRDTYKTNDGLEFLAKCNIKLEIV
jgi:dCMP deaminase